MERALWNGELELLYVAPERLMTPRFLDQLDHLRDTGRLALFAIDEAHCVSQWGHDFRPEYLQLSILPERYPAIPRIALTATADRQTREEIAERLNLHAARRFVSSFDRPNIRYTIVEKDDPRRQLLDFIREECPGQAGIVYCLSRRKVEETAAWLQEQGLDRPALPRRHDAGDPRRAPDPLPARGRADHGGDDRLRHGHRQARRALRRAPGPAALDRGLLPGDRPRRPRRPAGAGLDGLGRAGRGAAAPHDRRVRGERGVQAPRAQPTRRAGRPGRGHHLPRASICSRTSARTRPPAATATTACTRRRPGTPPRRRARP